MDVELNVPADSAVACAEPKEFDLIASKMALLSPNQQRMVHMWISGGVTIPDIAEIMGLAAQYVRNTMARPDIKDIIESIQMEEDELIRQGIKALRMKAMQKMYTLMDSRQEAIAYQAARDVLDRTGHKGIAKQEVNLNISFDEQLNSMMREKNINVIEIEDYLIEDIE